MQCFLTGDIHSVKRRWECGGNRWSCRLRGFSIISASSASFLCCNDDPWLGKAQKLSCWGAPVMHAPPPLSGPRDKAVVRAHTLGSLDAGTVFPRLHECGGCIRLGGVCGETRRTVLATRESHAVVGDFPAHLRSSRRWTGPSPLSVSTSKLFPDRCCWRKKELRAAALTNDVVSDASLRPRQHAGTAARRAPVTNFMVVLRAVRLPPLQADAIRGLL
jgi:hypothetical protein